jgi:hypothetical protein
MELYLHPPECVFMAWSLVKHRDNFTLTKVKEEVEVRRRNRLFQEQWTEKYCF